MSLGQISYQSELHDRGTYASGVGCRVVRGPDWKWGKQDGGEGHLGSVRRFDTVGEAIVVWDSGIVANYRCGTLGFDLRVLDSAPTGVEHPGTICEGCHESPIYGTRWKCVVCLSTDLCSTCYHSDKHSLTHQFLRITAPYKTRVIVGRRLKQRRVEALGLFPKARVVRGIDWSWGNQDCVSPLTSSGSSSLLLGASGSALSCRALVRANGEDTSAGPILLPTQGRVTDRRDWYPGAPRSAALVAWDSGAYNVYRVGYAGMVDLKAVRPAKGGSYYVDHLPLLADLRDWNSNESGRGLEEVTVSCAVDEDVADLCRDACGNPLVPNWTNLQELESRRRKTIGSSLGTDTQRYRHTAQSTRQSSRSEVVTHSGSHEHNSSVPQRISSGSAIPQEPAASSCLNVCTLASRLQLQSGTVESYAANHSIISRPPVAGTSRSRPNQVSFAQERDSDDTCVLRTSTAAPSGGLRNLGQTARSLITDLLRSNTSGPVVQSVSSSAATVRRAPESTGQTRTHTGIRSAVTSPPTSRIQNPCVRQEEQINRTTEHSSASTSSRSSRTRDVSGSHHAQRRETTTDERSRLVTLIPRAVVGIHADSVTREGGCAHTDPVELIDSNEPFSHTSSHTAGHRREPGSRMVYGVYNQLHGMVPDSGAPNSGQLGVGTDTDPMEAERRNCQRNHCRGQVGQSNEDLIRAAEEGNVKRLKCLLQHRHVNVDSKFAGVTALHVACQMGNVACVAVLLQFGAKRRLRDGSGNEAIHAAAQGGNVGIVRLLLSTRARHRLFGIPGVSTLDDGVIIESEESGSRDAAETFPDEDDVPDVNSRNALRQTALHLSVTRHDFMVAQCLLEEFNALPNLQDCDGDSPLHDAIAGLNLRIVELLLQHNADLTITNNSGQNPLHFATVLGEVNILQAILQHCLCQTPWLVDEPQPDGLTALHLASLHGHLEVTDLLLQAGADPNLTVQRPAGLTGPPVRGVESGPGGTSASSVSVLLTQSNFTALHLAVHKAHPDVVCLLLCYGARATTTRNTDGRSPMQLVLTTLAQTHDMQQHSGQSTRRFDVALVPFLASVARLLVRMADSLTVTSSSPGPPARQSRRRPNREEFEEQLISIDDPSEEEDTIPESFNDAACLTVPSPLCRRLKSTIQATLETGVPRLVLIAACLASAIGAESWSASCATEDDEPDTRNTESITEAFVADIFGEYLDPVLQLALQQCHMEAMNSMSQVRVSNTENETRSPRHHGVSGGAQPGTELLVDMDEIEEENLVDALLQADSLSEPAISLLPVGIVTVTENNAVGASGSCTGSENREGTGDIPEATNDIIFVPTPDGHATNVLHQPLTIANQLIPRLNNLCVHDPTPRSESHLLPPTLEEMDLEWRECLVCSEANRATVIIPCGHIITCRQCTSLIKKCLLCRMRITGFHEFTQCCECQQSPGVIIARPCNHMLWCKLCLKTKSNQLDIIDRICPTEQFDLTTHSSLILQTDQHQIDQSKRLSPKPSASSSSSSTLASSAVATVGAVTYQIGSTSMAAVDENGPGGAAGRSVSGVLPIAGVQQQKPILSDSFNQPQQQLNSTIESMGIGTNEWHEVPLARLLVMIGKVNSLLDDLMTGGLCIDGCPVCTQPIEALLPIIVACAGVEQQASFSRELELPSEMLAETNPSSNNNLSTSFGLPQTTNNRTADVFVRGPPESDILPTTSASIVARAERGTLDLHTVPNHTAVTPNNRLHQSTSRSDSNTLRKRNQRPQLCERELSKLKHELQVMREQIRCPICLDRSRNLVFMCGHATCQWCGDQVTACPICRRAVESRIILY